jgi:hypothetical protein
MRLKYREDVAKALEGARENKHKRLMNRLKDKRKQRFIDAFLAGRCADHYPLDAADALEANVHEPDYSSGLHSELMAQVARGYVRHGFRGPLPRMVATDLLASDAGDQLSTLSDIAPHHVSVELTLAHLEALGFELPSQVSVSVAHRATLLLLNRCRFDPMWRPVRGDDDDDESERAAIEAECA